MVKFDSPFTNIGGYEQIYEKHSFPTVWEHSIDVMYSKEFDYLKEVSGYKADWDSYGGRAPDKQSVQCGINFLSSFTNELKESRILPPGLPEFCLAPDGILGFEWDYARNENLFARIYSPYKIEYTITENNNVRTSKEVKSAEFLEMCQKKIQYQDNQAA